MRHNPATILLALGATISTVRADSDNKPVPKTGLQQSWASPAKETVTSGHEIEQQVALGWSPKPTEPPKPLFGRMMMPRADGYTLGPETCGFVPGNDGNSFTCVSSGYTCTPQGGFVGCCEPNSACSQIKTSCIDYQASATGACNLPSDFHTLCCGTSTLPACYTWVISTSASTDKAIELYTIFGCSLTAGTGTLLTVDPGWLATHTFGSTTTTASTTSSSPSATSNPDKSSTPVGAIAGGTVGGVAVLGLIGLAIFLLYRHRNPRNNGPPAGQPPQGQNNVAGGAVYPSGVPAGYAPVPMHQQGYYPPQFQGQYPPQQQQQQQQQYNYNYPVQTTSTSPVHTTLSPGAFKESEALATELPTTSPLGAETNRAELGGGN
ncbi:hypothetical protein ACQKWADRAFT_308267 [Trichoderma austrokoningii]